MEIKPSKDEPRAAVKYYPSPLNADQIQGPKAGC